MRKNRKRESKNYEWVTKRLNSPENDEERRGVGLERDIVPDHLYACIFFVVSSRVITKCPRRWRHKAGPGVAAQHMDSPRSPVVRNRHAPSAQGKS